MVPSIDVDTSPSGGGSAATSAFPAAEADRTWSDGGMTLDEFFASLSELYPDEIPEFHKAKAILMAQRIFSF